MYKEDTIAAIATAPGEGGVAIIRISGLDAESVSARIFARASSKNGQLKSHRLYHGEIREPNSGRLLDEVLLTIMRKPRSYTGEDVVEIHCHGGAFVARRVLALVLSQGARQAEPGEFTKRAFLNGRVDLSQAEAVLDLIRARTDKAAELALTQVSGELSKWVDDLREKLLDILVQIEAAIDFPEEDIELLQRSHLTEKIDHLRTDLLNIIVTYDWGRIFREGAKVCVCGRPNVGKSSLVNALLGADRVIVTPVPGTTRDVIEESINLDGLAAAIWDTAGMHETDDQVERIGVDLSRQYLEKADAVLVVLDGAAPMTFEDEAVLRSAAEKKYMIIVNKDDLPRAIAVGAVEKFLGSSRIHFVSAKMNQGIGELKKNLRELLLGTETEPSVMITNLRHKNALARSEAALKRAVTTLTEGGAPEFVAVDLNEARETLEEITGKITNDSILERIFSNYCIGK
jgi:tRNA modification GTPase